MKEGLTVGMQHTYSFLVPENKTVPFLYAEDPLFQKMPKVFATGFLVGLVELTCMQALEPYLEEGEGSVGIHVDLSHDAPTPPGMKVEVEVTVHSLEGRKITWDVTVKDEKDSISTGKHQRYIINSEKFDERVRKKSA